MAVINAYTDADAVLGKKSSPGNMSPGQMFGFAMTFEVAAADAIASVYRVANLSANLIPLSLYVLADDSVDMTTVEVGLYETKADGGAVADRDCFHTALDIDADTIYVHGTEKNALVSLPITDTGNKLWEIASVVTAKSYTAASHPASFDLAIYAVSEPGAAGTVSVWGTFVAG